MKLAKRLGRAALLGIILTHSASARAFNQAPDLQALVGAGSLPPVAERLPVEPLVLTPLNEVGTYGGDMRTDLLGGTDRGYGWLNRILGYEPPVRFAPEGGTVVPNIATSPGSEPGEHRIHLPPARRYEMERWRAGDRR
ncbi:hypothetical protein N8D56_27495 (plasmid) [Devosia sp. A8/3-2]|nr:hypothetical protein N8D56_27495 [Devosia sp. A8/3-2]